MQFIKQIIIDSVINIINLFCIGGAVKFTSPIGFDLVSPGIDPRPLVLSGHLYNLGVYYQLLKSNLPAYEGSSPITAPNN